MSTYSDLPPPYFEQRKTNPSAPPLSQQLQHYYVPQKENYYDIRHQPVQNHIFINNSYKKKMPRYHGPVINNNEKLKITTKYFDQRTNTETTNITLIDKNMLRNNNVNTIDQRNLDRNIRIDGLDPLPVFIDGHLARNSYFKEQQRILKDKYTDDMLKLESQRMYSHIAHK